MSFLHTENDQTQTMFHEILNCPLYQRCSELGIIIDRSSVKELQEFFVPIVNSIFGVPGGIGWGLRTITRPAAQQEFDLLCNFFTPLGPMFRLCYRLLNDSNSIKFEVPIEFLPKKTTQMLHSRHFSQFYADKMNIDPLRRELSSLSLNAFDFFMLHFVLYGMVPLHKMYPGALAVHNENWKTVYFYLTADYLCWFLPGNPDSVVQPSNICNSMKMASAMPIQPIQPTRSPTYLSMSALSSHNFSVDTSNIRTNEALRAHSWRTESVLLFFVDTWLRYNVEDNRDLPSSEFIRVVRILVKQLHSFGNVADLDNTTMSSLRAQAQPMMNAQMYTFLRGIIARWPLDSSFSVVLELWLSAIQPWRYIYNRIPTTPTAGVGESVEIHKRYESFIAENMICYTQIFVQLLPRFERLDFSSIKNVHMIYRLTKVLGQSNLADILRNNEAAATISKACVTSSASPSVTSPVASSYYQQHHHSSPRGFSSLDRSYHSDNSYSSANNRSTENMQTTNNQINEWNYFRPDNVQDTYICMFGSRIQSELQSLIQKLIITKEIELERAASMERQLIQSRAGFINYCRYLFSGDDNVVIEQALANCRKIPEILDNILFTISNMFEIELIDPVALAAYSSRFFWDDTDVTDAKSENVSDFLCPSPIVMRKRSRLIKYTGDPALIPIRSNESTVLVRILYQISARVNIMFSNEMSELWQRQDFIGRISRQILTPPMIAQSFAKSQGFSELIEEPLGPRLNLRFLGTYQTITTIFISFLMGQLLIGIPSIGFLILIIIAACYILVLSFINN